MNLRFNSEQGLVLDQALALYLRQLEQALALYLRQLEQASPHLTRGEREARAALVQELQCALQQAYHPRRKARD